MEENLSGRSLWALRSIVAVDVEQRFVHIESDPVALGKINEMMTDSINGLRSLINDIPVWTRI